MLVLILGGSASGKSEYAEKRVMELTKNGGKRLYLATMQPYGQDAEFRIKRHQKLRMNKGFETVERYRDLAGLCIKEDGNAGQSKGFESDRTILLECMSNLVANEMFDGDVIDIESVKTRILTGIDVLMGMCEHLVIVSIDVFGDGKTYDEMTMAYVECLGTLNQELAMRADEVVEVVYGLPMHLKDKCEKNADLSKRNF